MAGKRGNGEGSFRRRHDGRWEARGTFAGQSKSYYSKTRQDAARKLNAAIRDYNKGLPVIGDERQTVGEYLETWLADVRQRVKPSSYRRYGDYVRVHLIPGLGRIALSKLRPQQVQAFYTHKLASGLSSTTVQLLHGVLHCALKDAERMGLVQRNVTEQVRVPRRNTSDVQTLTEDQANVFLVAVQGGRWEALHVLALTTGMREGELLGLRWNDVNLDGKYLQVRVAVQEAGQGYVLAEPKTTHSRRRISLTPLAVEALRAHRVRQNRERLKLGAAWETSLNLVFPNARGGVMIPHNLIKRDFKQILKRAGLPDIHFHCLRHTAATLLLSKGVHPKVVSEMLGHADIVITLRTYAHVTPTLQQAAADTMERLFGHKEA